MPASRSETNSRVWDMVLNLVHPAAIYVLFQLLILDHFKNQPLLSAHGPLTAFSLTVYTLQFLGAWTVFYTTLLRDMGFRSALGTILLLAAFLAVVVQYLIFRHPAESPAGVVCGLLGSQLLLALIAFPLTYRTWRRARRVAAQHDPSQMALPIITLQQLPSDSGAASESNVWFYDWWMWIVLLVPFALMIFLAARNKKAKPALPHVTDGSWHEDVSTNDFPVVLHAYHTWSIGDRVVEAQVEKLAKLTQGRFLVRWFDIDKNPYTTRRFPTLEEKSVALFAGDDLLWQCTGVHDHSTMLEEILEALDRRELRPE